MLIREVAEEDAAQIARIYNYYIRNAVATFECEEIEPSSILTRIKRIKDAGHPWLVAVDSEHENPQVLGYAYASNWRDRSAYKHTVEISAYLDNSFEGKGIGSALYSELLANLRKAGVRAVIGGITLPNEASVALHEKFNMKKVAHFKQVGFKFDTWLDVGYWQAIIE